MKRILNSILILFLVVSFPFYASAEWVDADGLNQDAVEVFNAATTNNDVQLDIDSEGRPHIFFLENGGGFSSTWYFCYLYWNGSAWVDADGVGRGNINVPNTGEAEFISLDKNSSGNPTIAWSDDTPGYLNIYYLYWNGSAWVDADGNGQESIDIYDTSQDSTNISLKINSSNDYPAVIWTENILTKYAIYYLQWDGVNWVDADNNGQESIDIYPENISGY